MAFIGRLKFLAGILITIAIVAGLFLYLNYSMSRVSSRSAQLDSDAYSIGIEYPGVIEQQFAQVGQHVARGDKLLQLRSPTLQEAISEGLVTAQDLLFEVDEKTGKITVKATRDGTVQDVEYVPGSYVPANMPIVKVSPDNSLYISARYKLTAPDYARIKRDSDVYVTLPDNTQFTAKVYDISLEQKEGVVETVIKARVDQSSVPTKEFAVGTPVATVWQLDNNTWYSSIQNFVESLIRPKGA